MTSTRERPLLMNDWGVRAILDGHKVQTRRPMKPQPYYNPQDPFQVWIWKRGGGKETYCWGIEEKPPLDLLVPECPQGVVGDRLWLQEIWHVEQRGEFYLLDYNADPGSPMMLPVDDFRLAERFADGKWRPSAYMPRWASRVLLEIVDVRVERVQDISNADAMSEGVLQWYYAAQFDPLFDWSYWSPQSGSGAAAKFGELWDDIYAQKGLGWSEDPWVFALEFKALEA